MEPLSGTCIWLADSGLVLVKRGPHGCREAVVGEWNGDEEPRLPRGVIYRSEWSEGEGGSRGEDAARLS